ncbi:MAG TPA: replication initiator, partial [Candidatus Limnocylindrales bacterium]
GLSGGKTVPDTVRTHPRVFATLTAPSFGPVHNRPTRPGSTAAQRCRCGHVHAEDDPRLGTPLNPERYDYQGAVLWNAHAPALWSRLILNLRREIARIGGITQRTLASVVKVSYAKVAEYQKRGLVHFHAVIRLDGPDGTTTSPPAWATTSTLTDAIRAVAARTTVSGPEIDGARFQFAFGEQLDVRPIRSGDFGDGGKITEKAVAAYVAKYATKGAEGATGTLDRRLRLIAELPAYQVPAHAERMIRTAWQLGARRDLKPLKLRAWAPHARLPRPLLHQDPPLLHHPHPAPPSPHRLPAHPQQPRRNRPRAGIDAGALALDLRRHRPHPRPRPPRHAGYSTTGNGTRDGSPAWVTANSSPSPRSWPA